MNTKLRLLILYDYFYPGYRAGGPIQSLTNLAVALQSQFEVFVITGPRDLHSTEVYSGISINQWTNTSIPGGNNISVYYADEIIDKERYKQLFSELKPDVVYFNNIYSRVFFRLPLQMLQKSNLCLKIVICPRGMLQQGALAVKPLKKKIYLALLRLSGLISNAHWHATNREEADDIARHFKNNKGIVIASNIPKAPLTTISHPGKKPGELRLVFLSLIAEKKNVLLLLQLIKTLQQSVVLDIYGPITDESYWKECSALIEKMPEKVQYKGDVQPKQVQQVIARYHALILLTKGENFGHALYESLSVGRPIITSYFTPWNNLLHSQAGVNADISDTTDCISQIQHLTDMRQNEYDMFCDGAHHLAEDYYKNLDTDKEYGRLFGQS